ncbi:hypothetical protein GCM10009716_35420 [Streptomyces sodiiphilus]|uniref:DUF397 domain-containing protein n=1 Tax=Streptomyces sodiiphilus TaxID=226217 RepID=A0ABN2PLV5_9ACTN
MTAIASLSHAKWIKSSYSGNGGGSCIEWAPACVGSGIIPVRDSKNPDGPTLLVRADHWTGFVSAIKKGQLHV